MIHPANNRKERLAEVYRIKSQEGVFARLAFVESITNFAAIRSFSVA